MSQKHFNGISERSLQYFLQFKSEIEDQLRSGQLKEGQVFNLAMAELEKLRKKGRESEISNGGEL